MEVPAETDKVLNAPTKRHVFFEGMRVVLPLLVGILPFAVIAGSIAMSKGLTVGASFGFSLFIFAGASQLAALELIGNQAPFFIIILTVFMVNLRMLIYSAAIAPYFKSLPKRWKWLNSYLLTDQAFIFSSNHFQSEANQSHRRYYYFGVATSLWITWQVGSGVGILLGAKVPPSLSLEFAVPLSFLALVVPNLRDKASLMAGLSAGIGVILFAGLPMNLGFVLAVIIGIFTGVVVSNRSEL